MRKTNYGGRWPAGTPWIYRFWVRVVIGEHDGCWLWDGKVNGSGYGVVVTKYGTKDNPHASCTMAHRMAYMLVRGDIPKGKVLDHTCRTKLCCNPWHLEIVIQTLNAERAWFYRMSDKAIKQFREGDEEGLAATLRKFRCSG